MPTGHTTKKTMTAYRATLLRRLVDGPVARRTVSAAERRQFNDLVGFGWVADNGSSFTMTETGRNKLNAFQRALVAA